jgi:metallo-beta-lactamase class B
MASVVVLVATADAATGQWLFREFSNTWNAPGHGVEEFLNDECQPSSLEGIQLLAVQKDHGSPFNLHVYCRPDGSTTARYQVTMSVFPRGTVDDAARAVLGREHTRVGPFRFGDEGEGDGFLLIAAVDKAAALTEQQAAGGQFPVHDQRASILPAAQAHFDAADAAAGGDFVGSLLLCNQARPEALRRAMPSAIDLRGGTGLHGEPREATRVFDNLYYIGVGNVTAWAVATTAGIIVIDTLNNKEEWIELIEPGMRRLGLDPTTIKYVVVTHGHGDHFGGAAWLAEKYHARVLMSDNDWKLAPSMLDKPYFGAPPSRDMVIRDGQRLTLGGETLRLYITPGHTLGTVSALIPVVDRGAAHVAIMWGGTGFNFPHSTARFKLYSDSVQRFMNIALTAGADVALSNHPEIDNVNQRIALLKQRGTSDANPFVIGRDGVRRFLTTLSECALAYGEQLAH